MGAVFHIDASRRPHAVCRWAAGGGDAFRRARGEAASREIPLSHRTDDRLLPGHLMHVCEEGLSSL